MTQAEQIKAAKEFAGEWKNKGYEKGETARFWIDLLHNVFGIDDPTKFIIFEEQVEKEEGSGKNFIDARIPLTSVMIEQKSIGKDLRQPIKQSDGSLLTPFQQAKRYVASLPKSEHPTWIVTCNFEEFLIYNMENPNAEPESLLLKDLPKEYYRLQFLVNIKSENVKREEEVSVEAARRVGKLYDALLKQFGSEPTAEDLKGLNALCVRLVFCLYAEDAGIFGHHAMFHDYLTSFKSENIRTALIELFKMLDTKVQDRDKFADEKLLAFPYVNGGLFADKKIIIPRFNDEILTILLKDCSEDFDWSEISPTIFGATFESTLNPETRRSGGMHYTSIENIHKVIDPLFMNELNSEFEKLSEISDAKKRNAALDAFHNKISNLKFLDPACGSGNFLTETYLSLRRLENRLIQLRNQDMSLFIQNNVVAKGFIKVRIEQFYGIEINDFAVTVAKTALWIAESQMIAETEQIVQQSIDFLPLTTNAFIVEGNALRMDWSTLKTPKEFNALYAEKLNVYKIDENFGNIEVHEPNLADGGHYKELNVITKELEEKELPKTDKAEAVVYDYIMGNPPFVGYTYQTQRQKDDLSIVDGIESRNIDYVAGWYFKAASLVKGKETKVAFVSTNSITQGEQVAEVWKPIFNKFEISIDFAYQTFKWYSESYSMAHVHCVIVGFSDKNSKQKEKFFFDSGNNRHKATNINPYLLDAPTVFVEKRKEPLCKVSKINKGSQPTDGGNLIIAADEYDDFIKKEPGAKKFIREFLGAYEFINGKKRYCLWLVDASPAELRKMPLVMQRIEAVRKMRESSKKEATQNWAAYPYLFTENRQPKDGNYLLIPRVSSERRRYIPIGYLSSDVIASDAVQIVPNATLFEFGVLTSNIHNAWMRAVCGRLEVDYRYSNDIVYNNFPWPSVVEPVETTGHFDKLNDRIAKIESTAQAILDARAKYPDSSLADLYDEITMPQELRKAHQENDKAVMAAYGFSTKMAESECVAELFRMYEELAK